MASKFASASLGVQVLALAVAMFAAGGAAAMVASDKLLVWQAFVAALVLGAALGATVKGVWRSVRRANAALAVPGGAAASVREAVAWLRVNNTFVGRAIREEYDARLAQLDSIVSEA